MKKNIIRAASALLLLTIALALLAACTTTLSGTYESDSFLGIKTVYKFDGDKVSVSISGALETSGTYEIDGDTIKITIAGNTDEYSFARDGDKITIDGREYTKQK